MVLWSQNNSTTFAYCSLLDNGIRDLAHLWFLKASKDAFIVAVSTFEELKMGGLFICSYMWMTIDS